MRAIFIAATGMMAQQRNVENIANNIANANTTGFKRSRMEFQDLLYQNDRRSGGAASDAGTAIPSGMQTGVGVRPAAVYRQHEQGTIMATGSSLDVAIQGNGFLPVELPNGETAYTRAGSLSINAEGQLVTADGYRIIGPDAIPGNALEVSINPSGEVSIKLANQQQLQVVGQFQVATFTNESALQALGNNLFVETPASGAGELGNPGTDQRGTLRQGFVEMSNVNPVSEMISLISAQRAYEMNSKVIETAEQILNTQSQR